MGVSLRLSNEEESLFRSYAEMKKQSMSDMIRSAVLTQIEDNIDIKVYNMAMEEYRKNPTIHTHDEVGKMLGIT